MRFTFPTFRTERERWGTPAFWAFLQGGPFPVDLIVGTVAEIKVWRIGSRFVVLCSQPGGIARPRRAFDTG